MARPELPRPTKHADVMHGFMEYGRFTYNNDTFEGTKPGIAQQDRFYEYVIYTWWHPSPTQWFYVDFVADTIDEVVDKLAALEAAEGLYYAPRVFAFSRDQVFAATFDNRARAIRIK